MALLVTQQIVSTGYDATYVPVSADDGDLAVANEDLVLHVKNAASSNAVHVVSLTGGPGGGNFKLVYGGVATADIAYNAVAATVETAIEALAAFDPADVSVTGGAGGPWTITYGGAYANEDVDPPTATHTLTGGSGPGVSIVDQTAGGGVATVRVIAHRPCNFGFYHHIEVSVPANDDKFIGPFSTAYWDAQNQVQIQYEGEPGNLTIAALLV